MTLRRKYVSFLIHCEPSCNLFYHFRMVPAEFLVFWVDRSVRCVAEHCKMASRVSVALSRDICFRNLIRVFLNEFRIYEIVTGHFEIYIVIVARLVGYVTESEGLIE